MTNFKRISASPEALAEFIHGIQYGYDKSFLKIINWLGYASEKNILAWLKQESE